MIVFRNKLTFLLNFPSFSASFFFNFKYLFCFPCLFVFYLRSTVSKLFYLHSFLRMWRLPLLITCEFTTFLESFWLDKFRYQTGKLTQRFCRLLMTFSSYGSSNSRKTMKREKVKTLVCLRLRKKTGLPPH